MSSPGSELRRIRSLIADLDGIVWEADARTLQFTFVSTGASLLLGYTPQEWLASPTFWADHVYADDRERAVVRFVHAARAGWSFDTEYRFSAKDGRVVWLRDLGHVVKDAEGRPTLMRGLMTDVSKQKTLERDRKSAEERFRQVVERLPAIVYIQGTRDDPDEPGPILYVSPQIESILGSAPREWISDPQAWVRGFHPEDRERVQTEHLRSLRTGTPFSAQYRMFSQSGEVVWFHDEAVLVRDDEGVPLYWQGIMYDITRQRTSEERAQDSEARYRAVVEHIPAIVYTESIVDDTLQLIYVNPKVEALLGVTPEEWIADPEASWANRIHPDDRARVLEANKASARDRAPYAVEYRMIAVDGGVLWFQDEAVLVREQDGRPRYWQGVMTDITARKEAEAQLAEAEARYRALVEQTPTITYLDPLDEGPPWTLYISPQTTTMLGYTPQDWYDDPELLDKIVHPEDRERAEHAPESVGIHDATYRMLAKDGRVVWVHDQARLITDEEGKPRYWQGVLVDVTENKRAEELERDLALERQTADRLRQLDEMKNTFLQAVSHDLRTPLAAILGLAVTMSREDLDISTLESRDMANRIAQNAKKLDRLVTDLLDLDRLSRGIVEPNFRPADVGALVQDLVADSDLVAGREVDVRCASIVIPVDAAKVERIVENLIGNTVKHTPEHTRIWVRVVPWEDGALIAVDDDGPGVPPEMRERIFEPFLQGESASPHAPGVGVGLALVARFAELHDGGAWVQGRPGGGASFRVFLPDNPAGYISENDGQGIDVDQRTETGDPSSSDTSQA